MELESWLLALIAIAIVLVVLFLWESVQLLWNLVEIAGSSSYRLREVASRLENRSGHFNEIKLALRDVRIAVSDINETKSEERWRSRQDEYRS